MFKTYITSKIFSDISHDLTQSFNALTIDTVNYNNTGFQSRSRHFSAFSFENGKHKLNVAYTDNFNKKQAFHTKYLPTGLAPIDSHLVEEITDILNEVAGTLPIDSEDYIIGVNQIRVIANSENMGMPAPSLHQDGYEFSCHINVSRENVSGGDSILSLSKDPKDVFLEHTLQPNEYLFFNDKELYHTATPITPKIGGYETHRDMLILDYVRK